MKNNKLVSIIIVNYNGSKIIKDCLDSITNQSYSNFEVIVVDNNSTDESTKIIKKNYPNIKLIELKNNLGFTGGNNIGYKNSNGENIILLNNDTKVEHDYIEKFIKVFNDFPNCGIAQSKIVLYDFPQKLDCAGSFWTFSTYMYHFGYREKSIDKIYNEPYKIFSVKGASMIIKKEVIEKIGLFDEELWHYYEDTDLCHRAINAGYDIYYYPFAVCYHKEGYSRKQLNQETKILFTNTKNKLYSFSKNFEFPDVIIVIFKHLIMLNIYCIILFSKGHFSKIFTILKAILYFFYRLPSYLINRKKNKYKGKESILPTKKKFILHFVKIYKNFV